MQIFAENKTFTYFNIIDKNSKYMEKLIRNITLLQKRK